VFYEFGSCALDTATRRLTREGQVIAIARQTVEAADLSFPISTLRKALGDDGRRCIETVPRDHTASSLTMVENFR
jgi:DNA-binding winged helix-turn-helix (wHTH) protein